MKSYKILILALCAYTLISCGGAEERKAVYMEKAKVSMEAGDYEKARIELKNVLQIDPKDGEAYYRLGKVYEKQKNFKKAYSHYLKAEELDPNLLENQAQLGKIYLLLSNDNEKIQQKIDFILTKEPLNKDGLLLKSALMLKNENIDEAIAIAKDVVDRNPSYADGVTFLATLYFKNKKSQQAIAVLDKALAVIPDNVSISKLLGLILVNEKDYKRAELIYRKLLDNNPDNRSSYNILAAFYEASGNEDKSEKILRDSIENDLEDIERYIALINFIRSKHGNEAAISELKGFVSNNDGIGKLRGMLAELYLLTGDKSSAIDIYKKSIKDFPEEVTGVEARIALASIYLNERNIEQASQVVEDALVVSPNDSRINFLRAKIALINKDVEKAIISLRIVIKENPENINGYFLLAGAYQLENNLEQIKSTLNSAYENNRNNPKALLKLAEYYLSKNIDLAEKIIKDYNNLKKNDYDGMAIEVTILNNKKMYADAYKISQKLIDMFPERTAGYYHAAPFLVFQGDKGKAVAVLEEGYQKTKKNRMLLVMLTKLQVSEKQFEFAESRIKDELKTSPSDASLKIILAQVYMEKDDLVAAELLLKEVIKEKPDTEDVYLILTQIYQKQNNIISAKAILQQGSANVVASTKIPLRLATIYESNKEFTKATDVYRDLYKAQPENLIIINNLASMLSDFGKKEDLVLAKELVAKLDSNKQHVFMDTKGWVFYKLGEYETAIKYLSQAVDKAPSINIFNYHLGMAYKKAGDKTQAKSYLEKSLADGKMFQEKEQAKIALKDLQ